jgi:hypothetical protein
MNFGDKRKNPRRSIAYPEFLDLGDDAPPRECLLCDASQEGALLSVAHPKSLPDEFTLALSVDGVARRRCRVMWRGRDQVGVTFIKAFSAPVRALDVTHSTAPPPANLQVIEAEQPDAPVAETQQTEVEKVEAPMTVPEVEAQPPEQPAEFDESNMFDIDTLSRA